MNPATAIACVVAVLLLGQVLCQLCLEFEDWDWRDCYERKRAYPRLPPEMVEVVNVCFPKKYLLHRLEEPGHV
jgi:hypothetical protein